MDEKKVLARLSKVKLTGGKVLLVVSQPQFYDMISVQLLRALIRNSKKKGIYVTLTRPYTKLEASLKKSGVDTAKLFFIDGTEKPGSLPENSAQVSYVEEPGALTHLSVSLTRLTASGEYGFIYLDSLSTMAMYRELDVVQRFGNYLVNKLRELEMDGVVFSLDSEKGAKAVAALKPICDEYLEF
ncbi:MAG: hypothetical protein NTV88_04745 [Candidatus Micrarchaeota archaeon]|nr:hypothetical protein [Candidatus Micrarchaeota archaeon]